MIQHRERRNFLKVDRRKLCFLLMGLMLGVCACLEFCIYSAGGHDTGYTHFFYVPLIFGACWWGLRGGVLVALLLGMLHLLGSLDHMGCGVLVRSGAMLVAGIVAGAVSQRARSAEVRLGERVKELACFYGMSRILETCERKDLDCILQNVVKLVPPAWQYPEITSCCLEVNGRKYVTPGFRETPWMMKAPVLVNSVDGGTLVVAYAGKKPEREEGPFLTQERRLLDSIAVRVSNIIIRVRAEQEEKVRRAHIRQIDRMDAIGSLASGIAHEINNPNNVITLNTHVLKNTYDSISGFLDEKYETEGDFPVGASSYDRIRGHVPALFDAIINASRKITRVVADLRDFLRTDRVSDFVEIDIREPVEAAVNLTMNLLKKSTTSLSVCIGDETPTIRGSLQDLELVIVHLLRNACEALTDSDQPVEVGIEFDGNTGKVTVYVRDGGCGMDSETLARITDPYFTTRQSLGRKGLGLSICSGIVGDHGGELLFESSPGNGTMARVVLDGARG